MDAPDNKCFCRASSPNNASALAASATSASSSSSSSLLPTSSICAFPRDFLISITSAAFFLGSTAAAAATGAVITPPFARDLRNNSVFTNPYNNGDSLWISRSPDSSILIWFDGIS